MEVGEFFKQPGSVMIQALLLRFRPLNMDILPLYVLLMAFLPLVLQLARLHRDLPLVLSVVLYTLTLRYDLHLSTYPDGFWSFNPFAWQLLFVFGVWSALGGGRRISPIINSSLSFWVAIAYLCAAFRDHDLVFSKSRRPDPQLAHSADLSDRQAGFRHLEICAFPGPGRRRFAFRAERLGRIEVTLGAAHHPL